MKYLLALALSLAACTTPAATPPPSPSAPATTAPVAASPTPFFTTGSLRLAMNAKYHADGKNVTIGQCLEQTATVFVCTGSAYLPDKYGTMMPNPVNLTVTVGPDGSWIAQESP